MTRFLFAMSLLLAQDTLQVKVSLVTVPVQVTDSRGRDVRGLKVEDFALYDDGRQQKIEFFAEAQQSISLGILLDRSVSMRFNNKIARAKEAALVLARAALDGSEFFYIEFDDRVNVAMGFTSDRRRMEAAIRDTQLGGGTSLYDAVIRGVELSRKAQLPQQVLVIISDGTDQHSLRRLADALKAVRESKVQVYTIGYFSGTEEEMFRKAGSRIELIDGTIVDNPRVVLQKIAQESGAASFFPRSDRDLVKAVEEITHDVRTQYTLAFYPQSSDDKYHELRVTVRSGRYNVRARPGYAPGS